MQSGIEIVTVHLPNQAMAYLWIEQDELMLSIDSHAPKMFQATDDGFEELLQTLVLPRR